MSTNKQSVRFFTYSQYHGKYEPVGSDYLRAHQLIKYWPEAGLYKYGENPEALIFTKVFLSLDYQFPRHFKGYKILDMCDPMWFEGVNVVETAQVMDAVTCPTENLATFVRQFHQNVIVVPDRFDISLIPAPKSHSDTAKSVVWFGYSHNAELLRPAMSYIDKLGLKLIIISNDDPLAFRWSTRDKDEFYKYIKYNETNIWQDIQLADYAILPEGFRPEDAFKSNNKTIRANLAGLPVANTPEDMDRFSDASERQAWLDNNYVNIKNEYDCIRSIEQYKAIIND